MFAFFDGLFCCVLSNDKPVKNWPSKLWIESSEFVSNLSGVISQVVEARGDALFNHFVQSAITRVSQDFPSVFAPIPSRVPRIRCSSGVDTVHLRPGFFFYSQK